MNPVYRKFKSAYKYWIIFPATVYLKLHKSLLSGKIKRAKKHLNNEYLDSIPVNSEVSIKDSISGRFSVEKGTKYRCQGDEIKLITVELSSFKKKEKKILPGKDICIPTFVAHSFLMNSTDRTLSRITKTSEGSLNYSFEIDMKSTYSGVPEDFRLQKKRIKIAEKMLRFVAMQDLKQKLDYFNYSRILGVVHRIGLVLELSDFENALLYNMAFDWIQRLGKGKNRIANIEFGTYKRIYSSSGCGYHDVRATEINRNARPYIELEHKTHLHDKKNIPLPKIKIGKNVIIEGKIEIGLGLTIKDFSWIAANVSFLKHEHKPEGGGQLSRTVENTIHYPTEIGPYAMIGLYAKILPHVFYIGKGAVVGHSAIVTHSVGDYTIVGGNPARTIRYNIELARSLEEKSIVKSPSELSEPPIPFDLFPSKISRKKNIVIMGAKDSNTIITAAHLFKNVLGYKCCVRNAVHLLDELTRENLKNICLQSNNSNLIYELKFRKLFTLIWLVQNKEKEEFETDIFDIIKQNSEAILSLKQSYLSIFLKKSACIEHDPSFLNDNYFLFLPANK